MPEKQKIFDHPYLSRRIDHVLPPGFVPGMPVDYFGRPIDMIRHPASGRIFEDHREEFQQIVATKPVGPYGVFVGGDGKEHPFFLSPEGEFYWFNLEELGQDPMVVDERLYAVPIQYKLEALGGLGGILARVLGVVSLRDLDTQTMIQGYKEALGGIEVSGCWLNLLAGDGLAAETVLREAGAARVIHLDNDPRRIREYLRVRSDQEGDFVLASVDQAIALNLIPPTDFSGVLIARPPSDFRLMARTISLAYTRLRDEAPLVVICDQGDETTILSAASRARFLLSKEPRQISVGRCLIFAKPVIENTSSLN